MSSSVLDELRAEAPEPGSRGVATALVIARYGVKIALAVFERLSKGRGHGVYTTLVEEALRFLYVDSIGSAVWRAMKGDTADAFGGDPQRHGGTALIERIAPHLGAGARLTLVGHSTGAVYIAHFLNALHERVSKEVRADVVLLAPACTCSFLSSHLDVLRARVRRIRMFALTDTIESGYWEFPLYRGSLLYMVSGLFEQDEVDAPIVGMERYYATSKGPYAREDCRAVAEFIPESARVFSIADLGDGLRTGAPTHGAFDDDLHTLGSLTHFLRSATDV